MSDGGQEDKGVQREDERLRPLDLAWLERLYPREECASVEEEIRLGLLKTRVAEKARVLGLSRSHFLRWADGDPAPVERDDPPWVVLGTYLAVLRSEGVCDEQLTFPEVEKED